ncbi:MAG TPA: hypothetical protein VGM43_04250 [Bryobacteraceae bacterium]|jgi:hypothetical protein
MRLVSALTLALMPLSVFAGQPGLVSLSPASQTTPGATATTYTAVVSDTDGPADLAGVNFLIANTYQTNYYCWLYYNHANNSISVYSDGNWNTAPAGVPGSSLTGQQCSVDPSSVTATPSGNNLSLTARITLTGLAGTYPIFLNAGNNAGLNTGYQQKGTWTLQNTATPSFSISISPSVGYLAVNQTTTATVTITDNPGFSGAVNLSVRPLVNGAGFTATLDKSSITGSGTATLTIQTNSQTPPHNWTITIDGTTPDKTVQNSVVYTYAIDNGPPTLTMEGGDQISGSQAGVGFEISDGSKTADEIPGANILINSSLNGQNACWVWLDADTGYIWLANDDASSWSGMRQNGPDQLQNSQCLVLGQGSTFNKSNPGQTGVAGAGANITLKAGFSGTKIIFGRAANKSGYDSGYVQVGTWIAP